MYKIIILSILSVSLYSQNVKIEADPMLQKIIDQKKSDYKTQISDVVSGYRILIYNGSKGGAQSKLGSFRKRFPSIKSNMIYETPEFKVLCGYYFDRNQASEDFGKIVKKFPGSMIRRSKFRKESIIN